MIFLYQQSPQFSTQIYNFQILQNQKQKFLMSSTLQQINIKIAETNSDKSKITELNLQGVLIGKLTKQMTKALEQCTNLEILILSQCNLNSLQGLPKGKIQGIDLSVNNLTDKDVKFLKQYPDLTQLLLSDNKIQKLDSLKALQSCAQLQEVDISNNPVTQDANYRETMFNMLKSLSCLDGKDMDGNEVEEEQQFEQGQDDDEQQDLDDDDDQEQDSEDYDQDDEQSDEGKPSKKRK